MTSWIPPSFAWTTASDIFNIDVPVSDPDIVEFIPTGVRGISVQGTKVTALTLARLIGKETLRGQLEEAGWAQANHRPNGSRIRAGSKVVAHWRCIVVAGRGEPECRSGSQ